ncbi:peptidoglycan/LPS O-acetylase OafA/YrhL [Microbacterium resistens]|uniref:Peptidoglycan/LPS O-acetylase OafA/YrhL n=1 Tax=Microbacterium resistens TaxID=156977 RepID=A0ABU1SG31_9MICO|nr:acyltransferase [Microbacterium resistens]MDR6868560.1 peptidoglycan/LPS O-acetylase OafA/YrhL [Microbacterium resistens]
MARSIPRIPPDRDLSIDFVRAICLPVVVLLHALQMGISGEPLHAFNALAEWKPLTAITWVGMIMPTFFIAGGFAGITTWRRLHGAGGTAAEYIRARMLRLARPVLLAMLGVLTALGVLALCGVDPDFLRTFAFRLAEPLWFIAVYAICTSFVPLMAALHRRAAWATYFTLAGLAVAVDLTDRFLHVPIGPLNWLFVWLFVQQLGFGVRDQWYSRRPRWLLLLLAVAAYGLMAVAVFVLGYNPDMIANLNPPTVLLLLLGLAQVYLFTLLQPGIRAAMRMRPVLVAIGALGMFGMVIYLWHTVAMAVVVGVQLALGLPFPQPLTVTWWITRVPWVLAIVVVIAVFCLIVPRLERLWPNERARTMPLWAAIACTAALVVSVGWVLTQGYLVLGTGIAVVLLAATILWLTLGGPGGARAGRTAPSVADRSRTGV